MHQAQAFGLMEQDVGQHLDNSLYAIFKSLLGLFPVSAVLLWRLHRPGHFANSSDPARPVVEVVRNSTGKAQERIVVNTASSAECRLPITPSEGAAQRCIVEVSRNLYNERQA